MVLEVRLYEEGHTSPFGVRKEDRRESHVELEDKEHDGFDIHTDQARARWPHSRLGKAVRRTNRWGGVDPTA